jgi:hypothetical protein
MKPRPHAKHPGRGLPVDAGGGPTVDPTQNVKDLSEASNIRQDDLRDLTKELFDAKIDSLRRDMKAASRLAKLRATHQRELDHAESDRLNSIRQVDREEVAKTAATNQTATTALANQTSVLAETLRTQVGTVAAAAEARAAAVANAAENRLSQFSADVIKRLSALELSSSEGKGKQTVADPQMERLSALVETLARAQATGTGKGEGINLAWVALLGAVSLIVGLITIGGFVFLATRATPAGAAPQVIMVPAPVIAPPTQTTTTTIPAVR